MLDFKIDEFSVWEKLKNRTEPIVMYGTGNGADKVLDILDETGVKISGVTASAGFVRERFFRGYPVKPIEYFEESFGEFTVIITFGSSRPEVIDNIKSISQRHKVLVPCVPVIENEIFDRVFLENHAKEINLAYSVLADDFSKKIFSGYVNFQFGGELTSLFETETPESEAYTDILKLNKNETFVDIGAYRGDTVAKFLKFCGGEYKNIVAAEPDFKTFSKLCENCGTLPRFKAINAAVTGIDGEVEFSQNAGRQSAVGKGTLTKSVTLATLCEGISPSFIKIDSEGCELEILKAGESILKEFKPKLNIAAYHKSEDIFTLPILIKNAVPEYEIHLRHHPYIPAWDTIFYCV